MNTRPPAYIVYPSRSTEFKLWFLSDIHLGSKSCAEDKIAKDVQRIVDDPCSFWIGGGDYADFISHYDKRFDANNVASWVDVSDLSSLGMVLAERVRDLFYPIRHKCLGLIFGNHEDKYLKSREQTNIYGWLCTELETYNLGYTAMFHLTFVRGKTDVPKIVDATPKGKDRFSCNRFTVWCCHGSGGATTKGGKINRLQKYMNDHDAYMYFMGHVHDQTGTRSPSLKLSDNGLEIKMRERLGVVSGSYLRTYSQGTTGYGEVKGYSPATLGAAYIQVNPESRQLNGLI